MTGFKLSDFIALTKIEWSREQFIFMAKAAENAERYDDMCQFMRQLVVKFVSASKDLSLEERNLLSVAYKNVIGARRASWRTLTSESTDSTIFLEYKKQVEKELEEICKDVLDLLENYLLLAVKGKRDESEVFYYKMTADYYRYLAEFRSGETPGYGEKARINYEEALSIAKASLAPTHPIYLGLALNYSVCFYEILKQPQKACELAKQAFDNAIKELDSLDEASYKDSTLIMQLLRDNLTLWTQSDEASGKDAQPDD